MDHKLLKSFADIPLNQLKSFCFAARCILRLQFEIAIKCVLIPQASVAAIAGFPWLESKIFDVARRHLNDQESIGQLRLINPPATRKINALTILKMHEW
jgi:hypothetical protein